MFQTLSLEVMNSIRKAYKVNFALILNLVCMTSHHKTTAKRRRRRNFYICEISYTFIIRFIFFLAAVAQLFDLNFSQKNERKLEMKILLDNNHSISYGIKERRSLSLSRLFLSWRGGGGEMRLLF